MTARALHSDATTRSYFDFQSEDDETDDDAPGEFYVGERVCEPGAVGRGRRRLRSLVVLAMVCGGGWVALKYPAAVQAVVSAASSVLERSASVPVEQAAKPPVAEPPPVETRDVADAPAVEAGTAVPDTAAPAVETNATASDATAVAPLPPPTVDPADPYQTRALAVGLHPDLSRALLKRLTPTDYRNAGVAIRTALAETPDDGVFTWPREHPGKLALFEVHFVAGSSPACRRYVVTVTLARWSTTAPPMETCGADLPTRKVVKAGAG